MPERDTSGNQVTEDLTISTVSELDLMEEKYSGRKPLGLWADTWRRLKRNHLAVVGLGIIIVFLAVGMTQEIANLAGVNTGVAGTGYLAPYNPNAVNYELSPKGLGSPPSWSHPFGTDYLGRDVFSRVLVATRISMLEVIRTDYIRTARAKGLSERKVITKHAFKNAVIPVMTIAGIDLGALMGGAILTETVFARPGIGLMIYQAIGARDLPVVAGGVLFATIIYVFANLFVDLGYAYVDPRIRLEG